MTRRTNQPAPWGTWLARLAVALVAVGLLLTLATVATMLLEPLWK